MATTPPSARTFAAVPGVARGELGEAERAQERQGAPQHPGDEREPGATELGGHEPGGTEDPRPDHDADDHGEAVEQAQRSFEVRHGGRICTQKRRGAASRCAPVPASRSSCYGRRRPPPPPPPPPPWFPPPPPLALAPPPPPPPPPPLDLAPP